MSSYNKKTQLTQMGTRDSSAWCLKAHCEQNLSSPIPATDIGYNAFTYARWRHRFAWLLPFEWPNASILKGIPLLDAFVRWLLWNSGAETWTVEIYAIYVWCWKFHTQIVLAYLWWFWRKSLLKCVSQPKIAKKSINILYLIFKITQSIAHVGLPIISNLGPISHRFWDTATYWLQIANFPYPLSFSVIARSNHGGISRKALRILKLESSTDLTMKIWWS